MKITDFQQARNEALTGGTIAFIRELRQNPEQIHKVSRIALTRMFDGLPLWKKEKNAGGHNTYKHQITGVVIGFQAHSGKRKTSEIPSKQAVSIRDNLQEHLNIFRNEIFKCRWSEEPRWDLTLSRYEDWIKERANRAESA